MAWIQEAFPTTAGWLTLLTRILSHVVPADFVLGILRQLWHNGVGHSAGFLGMHSWTGWWYYYPVAFALKTTIPFLLLSLSAIGWGIYCALRKKDPCFVWLLAPFAIYSVFCCFSNIDIGVRYYLPAYSFLFILGGALLDRLIGTRRAHRAGAIVAIALVGWVVMEAWHAYPNHMSYMNQIASRAPHWWYLSDSNVEWGDDIPELAAYLRARGETRVRSSFLGDFILLHHYGVEALKMPNPRGEEPDKTRYAAIGASFLNGSTVPYTIINGHPASESETVNYFDKYRHKTPEAIFGNSIYLYREDLDGNQ